MLAELAAAPLADQAWLRAVAAFGELHARPPTRTSDGHGVTALLLLSR